jgi:hypothetical protein
LISNQSLFELKSVQVSSKSGRVVNASRLTVFYLVEQSAHINGAAGKGLKIQEASDSESSYDETPSPRKRRNRGRNSAAADTGAGGNDNTEMND